MKNLFYKLFILLLLLSVLFVWGCGGEEEQQEADRLKGKEKQVIEEGKQELKQLITEMDQTKDSLQKDYKQVILKKKISKNKNPNLKPEKKNLLNKKDRQNLMS